jgi:histone H3/H4
MSSPLHQTFTQPFYVCMVVFYNQQRALIPSDSATQCQEPAYEKVPGARLTVGTQPSTSHAANASHRPSVSPRPSGKPRPSGSPPASHSGTSSRDSVQEEQPQPLAAEGALPPQEPRHTDEKLASADHQSEQESASESLTQHNSGSAPAEPVQQEKEVHRQGGARRTAQAAQPRNKRKSKQPVAATASNKRPHRYRAGTVALRDIRKYQKSVKLLIPLHNLHKLVKEYTERLFPIQGFRWGAEAMAVIHEATEKALVDHLDNSNLCAVSEVEAEQGLLLQLTVECA